MRSPESPPRATMQSAGCGAPAGAARNEAACQTAAPSASAAAPAAASVVAGNLRSNAFPISLRKDLLKREPISFHRSANFIDVHVDKKPVPKSLKRVECKARPSVKKAQSHKVSVKEIHARTQTQREAVIDSTFNPSFASSLITHSGLPPICSGSFLL